MKTRALTLIASALTALTLTNYAAAALLYDDFNDGTIDAGLWNPYTPFGGSQVYESGGYLHLIQRGGLNAVPTFGSNVDIQGRFRFSGENDHFRVVFRSSLTSVGSFAEEDGMIVVFNQDGTFGIGESQITGIASGFFPFQFNTDVDFRIADDGNLIRVFLSDLSTPTLSATSSYRTGNGVGFYNREIGGTHVQVDFFQITDVPEPSTLLLSVLSLAAGSIRCRRHNRA